MAATVAKRISQETFDSVVQENVDDFEMPWDEAVADAIEQFEANNIDLSNIDTKTRPEDRVTTEHPLVAASKQLVSVTSETPPPDDAAASGSTDSVLEHISKISALLLENGDLKVVAGASGAMQGAWQAWGTVSDQPTREASVRLLLQLVDNCDVNRRNVPTAWVSELCSIAKSEAAGTVGPPSIYMSALVAVCTRGEDFKRQCRAEGMLDLCLQQAALAVPECALQGAQAAAESTPQLACSTLGDLSSRSVHQLVCLLKAIVSGDDSSATVSKAFDHAREVVGSKVAAVYTLIASCVNSAMAEPAGTGVPPIVKDCVSLLRCLAVNDSICVQFTDDGALQLLTSVAEKYPKHAGTIRNVCGAMKKLAHSDHVKRAVCAGDAKPLGVLLSGLQGFMTDASVVEQALAALSVSVLRTPDNAQMVADRDALPYIAKAMQLHPDAAGLQRQACLCIRNLVSRSKSSLTEPLLEEGVEALLRAAQASHPACLDVAKAALRDLGL